MKNIQDQIPNAGVQGAYEFDENLDEWVPKKAGGGEHKDGDVHVTNDRLKVEVVNQPEPVTEVTVKNLGDIKIPQVVIPAQKEFPKTIDIGNWPTRKPMEFPEFPKAMEVSNLKDLKLPAPQVNVAAPVVNVPAPVVNVPAPVVNVPPAKDFPTTMNVYQHVMKDGKWIPVEFATPAPAQRQEVPAAAPMKFPTVMNVQGTFWQGVQPTRDDVQIELLKEIRDLLMAIKDK